MAPRTIVLTGASSGIGEAAARLLAAQGHRVVPLGRDPARTAAVARAVGSEPVRFDLADFADVRRTAALLMALPDRIDVLALNAGAMFADYQLTRDGIEASLQTNHLGHFLLQRLLHDRLIADRSTVVLTCSLAAHLAALRSRSADRADVRYRMVSAYADAKLAGLLTLRELARRSRGTSLTAVAFHPGTANTPFPNAAGGRLAAHASARRSRVIETVLRVRSAEHAAGTLVALAGRPPSSGLSAHYLGPTGREALLPRRATDRALGAAIWEMSMRLTGAPA